MAKIIHIFSMVSEDVIDFIIRTSNHLEQASTTFKTCALLMVQQILHAGETNVTAVIPMDATVGLLHAVQAANRFIDMYRKP